MCRIVTAFSLVGVVSHLSNNLKITIKIFYLPSKCMDMTVMAKRFVPFTSLRNISQLTTRITATIMSINVNTAGVKLSVTSAVCKLN